MAAVVVVLIALAWIAIDVLEIGARVWVRRGQASLAKILPPDVQADMKPKLFHLDGNSLTAVARPRTYSRFYRHFSGILRIYHRFSAMAKLNTLMRSMEGAMRLVHLDPKGR